MCFEKVKSLPTSFNGDVMFELPLVPPSTSTPMQHQIEGMDKKFDGHMWSGTQTTNIVNDYGLPFRSSVCVGHIRCINDTCPRLRRSGTRNKTEWDGVAVHAFAIGDNPPPSTLQFIVEFVSLLLLVMHVVFEESFMS
jgi:hypothetical protein